MGTYSEWGAYMRIYGNQSNAWINAHEEKNGDQKYMYENKILTHLIHNSEL